MKSKVCEEWCLNVYNQNSDPKSEHLGAYIFIFRPQGVENVVNSVIPWRVMIPRPVATSVNGHMVVGVPS